MCHNAMQPFTKFSVLGSSWHTQESSQYKSVIETSRLDNLGNVNSAKRGLDELAGEVCADDLIKQNEWSS
jgi:hypothetical protein